MHFLCPFSVCPRRVLSGASFVWRRSSLQIHPIFTPNRKATKTYANIANKHKIQSYTDKNYRYRGMTSKSRNTQPQKVKNLQCGNWMQKKLVNTLRERRREKRKKSDEKNLMKVERKTDDDNGKPKINLLLLLGFQKKH